MKCSVDGKITWKGVLLNIVGGTLVLGGLKVLVGWSTLIAMVSIFCGGVILSYVYWDF